MIFWLVVGSLAFIAVLLTLNAIASWAGDYRSDSTLIRGQAALLGWVAVAVAANVLIALDFAP